MQRQSLLVPLFRLVGGGDKRTKCCSKHPFAKKETELEMGFVFVTEHLLRNEHKVLISSGNKTPRQLVGVNRRFDACLAVT
jgi:hypothetical protein